MRIYCKKNLDPRWQPWLLRLQNELALLQKNLPNQEPAEIIPFDQDLKLNFATNKATKQAANQDVWLVLSSDLFDEKTLYDLYLAFQASPNSAKIYLLEKDLNFLKLLQALKPGKREGQAKADLSLMLSSMESAPLNRQALGKEESFFNRTEPLLPKVHGFSLLPQHQNQKAEEIFLDRLLGGLRQEALTHFRQNSYAHLAKIQIDFNGSTQDELLQQDFFSFLWRGAFAQPGAAWALKTSPEIKLSLHSSSLQVFLADLEQQAKAELADFKINPFDIIRAFKTLYPEKKLFSSLGFTSPPPENWQRNWPSYQKKLQELIKLKKLKDHQLTRLSQAQYNLKLLSSLLQNGRGIEDGKPGQKVLLLSYFEEIAQGLRQQLAPVLPFLWLNLEQLSTIESLADFDLDKFQSFSLEEPAFFDQESAARLSRELLSLEEDLSQELLALERDSRNAPELPPNLQEEFELFCLELGKKILATKWWSIFQQEWEKARQQRLSELLKSAEELAVLSSEEDFLSLAKKVLEPKQTRKIAFLRWKPSDPLAKLPKLVFFHLHAARAKDLKQLLPLRQTRFPASQFVWLVSGSFDWESLSLLNASLEPWLYLDAEASALFKLF